MKVESISIKNFKAIEQENISLNGRNVYVLGPNGSGKSSFLQAIFTPLTGQNLPSKLTRDGADRGTIKVELTDGTTVETKFNSKKEKFELTVSSAEGAVYKSPRTMLDEKIGVIDFDLNGFFSLQPKKKVDFIKQLVGIDFTDLDEQYKSLFDERTYVNRQVKELAAVCDNLLVDNSKTEKIDLAEVQAKLEQAQNFNLKWQEVANRLDQRNGRILSIFEEVEELKERIRLLQEEGEEMEKLNIQAQTWLHQNDKVDTTAIRAEFETALIHNTEVDKTLAAKAQLDKYNAAVVKQNHLNAELAKIEQVKKEEIAAAKLPVPGLTFDDSGLYLNGLPFEPNQINTSQLIIAGLQINLAMMKDVKIARFDGSLLDNKSLAEVEAWAAANDVQLFVEMVERDTEGMRVVVQEEMREEVAA